MFLSLPWCVIPCCHGYTLLGRDLVLFTHYINSWKFPGTLWSILTFVQYLCILRIFFVFLECASTITAKSGVKKEPVHISESVGGIQQDVHMYVTTYRIGTMC